MIQNSQCSYSKVGEKFKIKSKLIKLSKGDFFSKTRQKWHESKDVNFIIIIIARSIFYLALITNQNCQSSSSRRASMYSCMRLDGIRSRLCDNGFTGTGAVSALSLSASTYIVSSSSLSGSASSLARVFLN